MSFTDILSLLLLLLFIITSICAIYSYFYSFTFIKSSRTEVEELREEVQEEFVRIAASQAKEQPEEEAAAVPEYFGTVFITIIVS